MSQAISALEMSALTLVSHCVVGDMFVVQGHFPHLVFR